MSARTLAKRYARHGDAVRYVGHGCPRSIVWVKAPDTREWCARRDTVIEREVCRSAWYPMIGGAPAQLWPRIFVLGVAPIGYVIECQGSVQVFDSIEEACSAYESLLELYAHDARWVRA